MGRWSKIEIDEILDFNGGAASDIAKYDRIMQHYLTESVNVLSQKLVGVMETIYKAHQSVDEKADELQKTFREITDKQINAYEENANRLIGSNTKISNSQSKLQKFVIFLTFVLVGATIAYTLFTWQSVKATLESNELQNSSIQIMKETNKIQLRTVTAMEEANKIQEKMAKINEAIYGYEHVKNINKSNNRP
ncbi:MAG: hypothetical protein FP816_16095 [Desulfobacteraceae bacterium]|nr:hypothetical protein [Desulfobacteraceae bacterium]MBU4037626.1 hypothetical protein [Pseudomonadota bacterium]